MVPIVKVFLGPQSRFSITGFSPKVNQTIPCFLLWNFVKYVLKFEYPSLQYDDDDGGLTTTTATATMAVNYRLLAAIFLQNSRTPPPGAGRFFQVCLYFPHSSAAGHKSDSPRWRLAAAMRRREPPPGPVPFRLVAPAVLVV